MNMNRGLVILIAESDPTTAELVQEALQKSDIGDQTEIVHDGRAVVEETIKKKPRLVILEIILSGKNGLAVCEELKHRKETAAIPVLIYSLLDLPERSFAAGADGFLKKPIVRSALIRAVRGILSAGEEEEVEGVA